MFSCRVVVLGLALPIAVGRAQSLRTYEPRTLVAVPWPLNATTPQDRGVNFTAVHLRLGGARFTLTRWETGWGTCTLEEGFTLYQVDSALLATARSYKDTTAAWHQLWDAPSYEMLCAYRKDAPGGEGPPWWVGACFLVADDSLVGYGVAADTFPEARAFADSIHPKPGYYRFEGSERGFQRVAGLGAGFGERCRRDVHNQGRDHAP